ncbi:MAG: hypothetical protein EHM43_10685, partial [Ignavibacteriae bacterium]
MIINPTLQRALRSKKITSVLTMKVDPAILGKSKVKSSALVDGIRAKVVAARPKTLSVQKDRFKKVKLARGKAVRIAVKSRAMRSPEQIIAAFMLRIKTSRRAATPSGTFARLIIRSAHTSVAQFNKPLTTCLGVDPATMGITVTRLPLRNPSRSSFSVMFPIEHNSVRTELMNVAWALRKSGLFHSVAVSGLKGMMCAPTAATRAERSFSWHLDLTRTTRAHQIPPETGGRALGEDIVIAHLDTGWAEHSQYNVAQINQRDSRNIITGATGGTAATHSILNRDAGTMMITHGTATGSVILGGPADDGKELISTVADDALSLNAKVVDVNGHLTGVAPKATVLPIKFISDNALIETPSRGVQGVGVFRIFDNDLVDAITYAVGQSAHVITLSVGGLLHDEVREAIDDAVKDNVIVVAAVGQTYTNNSVSVIADTLNAVGFGGGDSVILPAAYSNVIAVAGCGPSGAPWSESHRGPNVDITAPANAVWVAEYQPRDGRSDTSRRRETLECASGTSFAAPLVAGAAALWLAHHGRQTLIGKYESAEVPLAWVFRQLLQSTARPVGDWDEGLYGPGIIDVEALLKATLPEPANVLPPPAMVVGVVPAVSDVMLEFIDWVGTQSGNLQREAAVLWLAGQQSLNRTITVLGDTW